MGAHELRWSRPSLGKTLLRLAQAASKVGAKPTYSQSLRTDVETLRAVDDVVSERVWLIGQFGDVLVGTLRVGQFRWLRRPIPIGVGRYFGAGQDNSLRAEPICSTPLRAPTIPQREWSHFDPGGSVSLWRQAPASAFVTRRSKS